MVGLGLFELILLLGILGVVILVPVAIVVAILMASKKKGNDQ
jgi:CHASE1-domain containing sensor protein